MSTRPVTVAGPRGVPTAGVGLGVSIGAGVVLDGSGVLVRLAAGGLVVLVGLTDVGCRALVGLAVDRFGVLVAVAVDGTGISVGVWVVVESGLGGARGLFADAVAVGGVVGDWVTAGGVGVAPDAGLPGDAVGVCVTATCGVTDGDPEGRNAVVPSVLLPTTTVAITHIKLAAISAPIVRTASRGNERLLLIRLLNRLMLVANDQR